MQTPYPLLIALAILALAVAMVLWMIGIVPWWAVFAITIGAPIVGFITLVLLFYALWIASGSH